MWLRKSNCSNSGINSLKSISSFDNDKSEIVQVIFVHCLDANEWLSDIERNSFPFIRRRLTGALSLPADERLNRLNEGWAKRFVILLNSLSRGLAIAVALPWKITGFCQDLAFLTAELYGLNTIVISSRHFDASDYLVVWEFVWPLESASCSNLLWNGAIRQSEFQSN